MEDFEVQSNRLTGMFIDKGYEKQFLDRELKKIRLMDRESLIIDKGPRGDIEDMGSTLIFDYNIQFKAVEQIFNKYWQVLKQDKVIEQSYLINLNLYTTPPPPNLRDKVVRNVVKPPRITNLSFWDFKGFHSCGRCYSCVRVPNNIRKRETFINLCTSKSCTIRDFVLCETKGVVYALKCPSKLLYIGRTKRPLKKIIEEHVRNMFNFKRCTVDCLNRVTNM